MEVLYITMGITVLLAVLFLFVFLKNVKNGQYEDTQTPAMRILFDDELVKKTKKAEVTKDRLKISKLNSRVNNYSI